ncbi:armadillo-type protein [Endogone sp. FLAS-F59071]|nr:armadillo-type protein [Endogone sp. FLAS-F59071]|eukprot:RUS23174.1 armadillo-type protein [Endogone sp. FLAS-F59071]
MSSAPSTRKAADPFVSTTLKLWKLANFENAQALTSLDIALDSLLALDYPLRDLGDQLFSDLLLAGCKTVNTKDRMSCPKFCKLIKLVHLRQQNLETLLHYFLKGLKETDQAETRVDILRALSTLVFENTANTYKHTGLIVSTLLPLAQREARPLEVRRMAINCFGNLCAGAGSKLQQYYQQIFEILMGNIHVVGDRAFSMSAELNFGDPGVRKGSDLEERDNDTAHPQIASSTLRALQLLINEDPKLIASSQFDTIEIVRTFVFYLVEHPGYGHVDHRRVSDPEGSLSPMSPSTPLTPRSPSRRPSFQMKPLLAKRSLASSDSELSDGGSIGGQSRQRDDARIRINALSCLQTIAKTSPRALYPHWTKFIPDTPTTVFSSPTIHTPQPPSLFTILARDPAYTVRVAACNALMAILDGAKQYLSVAAERDAKSGSSFTSLSEKMAFITRELHIGLAATIVKETHQAVLVLLFKCARVLVENCSYDRLSPGYLTKLYVVLVGYQTTSIPLIRSASLNAIAAVVDAKSGQNEIGELMQGESLEPPVLTVTAELPTRHNLLGLLREIVGSPDEAPAVRCEAWSVFCACTRTQPNVVRETWPELKPILQAALADADPSIRTAALTFTEAYTKALSELVVEKNDLASHGSWWDEALDRYIQQCSEDKFAPVRALACDCLSNMPTEIFVGLTKNRQRLCVVLLLGLASDDDGNVRAAACRALGVFILFQDLREDPLFITDMAMAVLLQLADKNVLVRVRASWALGNLCDALVLQKNEKSAANVSESLSQDLWLEIVRVSLAISSDNDKLKPNGVRALGSIMCVGPKEYISRDNGLLMKEVVVGLIKNIDAGSLKVRWNACHAASNMLLNPDLPLGMIPHPATGQMYLAPWTVPLYDSLLKSLRQCKNFKVRINAALALASPPRRGNFGDARMYARIVETVVEAIEHVDDVAEGTSFVEMKYVEQYSEQLVATLTHLDKLATAEDRENSQTVFKRATVVLSLNAPEATVVSVV